jgi:hypothetical protein
MPWPTIRRVYGTFLLMPSQLLAHFEENYPQSQPWQLRTLRLPMHSSALISALVLRTCVTPQLVLNAPTPMINTYRLTFCTGQHVDPLLASVTDTIPYLQVIAQRHREGCLAKNGLPIRSRSLEDALCAVGQTMDSLGSADRRFVTPSPVLIFTNLKNAVRGAPPPAPRPPTAPLYLSFLSSPFHNLRFPTLLFVFLWPHGLLTWHMVCGGMEI